MDRGQEEGRGDYQNILNRDKKGGEEEREREREREREYLVGY